MIKVLSKILKSNKIQVVGIYEDSDSLKIHVLTLKKEKNKLIILDNASSHRNETIRNLKGYSNFRNVYTIVYKKLIERLKIYFILKFKNLPYFFVI